MTQALGPVGPFLYALILFSLGIGLPIIIVLAIRFLYYRHVYLGRSRELDKLIWQLHRIATSLEHEKGLSFPAEQPGAERDDAKAVAPPRPAAAMPAVQSPSSPAAGTLAPGATTAAKPEEPHRAISVPRPPADGQIAAGIAWLIGRNGSRAGKPC